MTRPTAIAAVATPLPVAAATCALGCAALTWRQIGFWQDSETLFRHIIATLGTDPYRADIYRRLYAKGSAAVRSTGGNNASQAARPRVSGSQRPRAIP